VSVGAGPRAIGVNLSSWRLKDGVGELIGGFTPPPTPPRASGRGAFCDPLSPLLLSLLEKKFPRSQAPYGRRLKGGSASLSPSNSAIFHGRWRYNPPLIRQQLLETHARTNFRPPKKAGRAKAKTRTFENSKNLKTRAGGFCLYSCGFNRPETTGHSLI
jgi:hypothetical protein